MNIAMANLDAQGAETGVRAGRGDAADDGALPAGGRQATAPAGDGVHPRAGECFQKSHWQGIVMCFPSSIIMVSHLH